MSRLLLNITAGGRRRLARHWGLPLTPGRLWQECVAGSLFSGLEFLQTRVVGAERGRMELRGAVVVLGYWRSGTTLLHELLCLNPCYCFPSTHACMNPHHFVLTRGVSLDASGADSRRPMDEMVVSRRSPQEDEFAMLSLGARSPYEALLVPRRLPDALALADPECLTTAERMLWEEKFLEFLKGVVLVGGGRPIILKSPSHGYRLDVLRRLLPESRYILIVRDPLEVFESAVAMWSALFGRYAAAQPVSEDWIRCAVEADRVHFETRLAAGRAGIPADQFAEVRFEELTKDPVPILRDLTVKLSLDYDATTIEAIRKEWERRGNYRPARRRPGPSWTARIMESWAPIIEKYGYQHIG